MSDLITIAILAKDKAHTLPLYLSCIEALSWPKNQTLLHVRTNNNNDMTSQLLDAWLGRVASQYAEVEFDCSDLEQPLEQYAQHEWNPKRFEALGRIRQNSMEWAQERGTDYFVADCDNFVLPETLTAIASTGLEIVAPLLLSTTSYSNYHAAVDANGYFADTALYYDLLHRHVTGLVAVPVVHCTYFVRHDVISHLRYLDDSGRHEYVNFSESARTAAIPQYIDNRSHYGWITFAETSQALDAEPWISDLREMCALPPTAQARP